MRFCQMLCQVGLGWRCRVSVRQFNERSGGVLNRTCLPSDIIAFVVFCRLRYRLTLRDLSDIMAPCGIEISHKASPGLGGETVADHG
jgi:hypothetical protein